MSSENTKNNQTKTPSTDGNNETAKEKRKTDPVKIWTWSILGLCAALFIWHILSDKYTPYTSNGRIEAFVVPVAPQVSGPIANISVSNNQAVSAGERLASIDAATYELEVRRARTELKQAYQASEADIASVETASAKVAEAEANLRNAEIKGRRIIKLSQKGAASMSRADDARSRIEADRAKLASARSELEKAKSNLGASGVDNTRIEAAFIALEKAELNLYRTAVRAPADGIITNLNVDTGYFAGAGTPVMTFISTKDVWVQADMRENSLGHIRKGDPVEMVLDAAPGRIFSGEVMSVGYGVANRNSNAPGSLATVQTSSGWLRQAQHFPVLIRFTDERAKGFRRVGGQVDVIVYTGERPVLNSLGWLWIRIVSILSHIY